MKLILPWVIVIQESFFRSLLFSAAIYMVDVFR